MFSWGPSRGFKKTQNFILNYFPNQSLKNNIKNFCTPFTRIPCLTFATFACILMYICMCV